MTTPTTKSLMSFFTRKGSFTRWMYQSSITGAGVGAGLGANEALFDNKVPTGYGFGHFCMRTMQGFFWYVTGVDHWFLMRLKLLEDRQGLYYRL